MGTLPEDSEAGSKLDERLAVRATLEGDVNAFEPLVKHYREHIHRMAARQSPNAGDAADATQEIFLKAYRSLHTFKLEGSFGAWLTGIARNHLRSKYSRFMRLRDHESVLEFQPVDSAAAPVDELQKQDDVSSVHEAISRLKTDLREVVERYYLEEQSVGEIANELGLSNENVKSKLHRSRKELRKLLGSDEKDATDGRDE
ncbi:MAG: sigma-70 family RNA polymerase sigma factor [Spirochaeta sp.]|nr:sigma-70 family RNA polymerase sigma factor [Spirochaeta sp.]